MKLHYTTGCTCTSLTVDGKETIDMSIEDFQKVIHKMIDYAWSKKSDTIQEIIKNLLQETGEFFSLEFGDKPVYNQITVNKFVTDPKLYFLYIETPCDESLLVCEEICSYTGMQKQERWNNEKHCNEENLKAIHMMVDKVTDFADLQDIFCKIMESLGNGDEPYHCGCCGDWIYSYDLTI